MLRIGAQHEATPGSGSGFLKENAELIGIALRFFDLTLVVLGAIIAHYIRADVLTLGYFYKIALIIVLCGVALIFPLLNVYKPWRGGSVWSEIRLLLFGWLLVMTAVPVLLYFTKTGELYSRLWFGWWTLIVAVLMVASRIAIRQLSRAARRAGFNTRNVLIVGSGKLGQSVYQNLLDNEWAGINVIGIVSSNEDGEDENRKPSEFEAPLIGGVDSLDKLLQEGKLPLASMGQSLHLEEIDQVWVALPTNQEQEIRRVFNLLEESALTGIFVPDIFLHSLLKRSVDEFAGMPVVNLRATPITGTASTLKLLEDIVVSVGALLFFAPLMLIVSILIKLESPGPVLFKQRRYGMDGKEITVWKFRTMKVMEDGEQVRQATRGDSRVTRIGSILRKTSLDELPQFFNVLQGKMSVVGPRPHAVAHNEQYRKLVDHYMLRCVTKPGITGWAQVNGWRGETDTVDKMRKRVEFDIDYLRKWSLWLDVKIIAKTIFKGMYNKNAY